MLLVMLLASAGAQSAAPSIDNAKRVCAYSAHSISVLADFDRMVHRDIDCAVVFANGQSNWSQWEKPWFIDIADPNNNWARWATATGTSRQLVITQNLIPTSAQNEDWRHLGAEGAYEDHARALARNLVAAGLEGTIIRLSHEANGDWFPDSIGNTDERYALWAQFWRRTVIAMRSMPGAQFRFDWCINGRYRPIALDKYYPGDDVVDIVGIDAYDGGVPAGQPRWTTIYGRPSGIRDVERFAAAHDKPMSIPEWGVAPVGFQSSGGDDDAYIDGIASVVRTNNVAYQSYFFNREWAWQLANGPASLAAYIGHFGVGGDSVGSSPTTVAPTSTVTTTAGTSTGGDGSATPTTSLDAPAGATGGTATVSPARAEPRAAAPHLP